MFSLLRPILRRAAIPVIMLLVSGVSLAQTGTANVRSNADDLKAIRESLERIVQLTQELDKNQKAILTLQQMQLYEIRLQSLETRDDALADRETELSTRSADLERAATDTESGVGPTGLPAASPSPALHREAAERLESHLRLLSGIRAKRQQIQHEIASLRSRMESLQKTLAAEGIQN